jgi:hypothetical protein
MRDRGLMPARPVSTDGWAAVVVFSVSVIALLTPPPVSPRVEEGSQSIWRIHDFQD